MASFEYHPFCDYVTLTYICPDCGKETTSDALPCPSPDWDAESHHRSIQSDFEEAICEHCGAIHQVSLCTGIYGGEGEISDVEQLVDVEEDYPGKEEEIDEYIERAQQEVFLNNFKTSIGEVRILMATAASLPSNEKAVLHRLLFANVIASLEIYLYDALINKVFSSDDLKRHFVENFHDFKEKKVALSDIYRRVDNIDGEIRSSLKDIIYHNLDRVGKIYKGVFNVDFGEIKHLLKYISTRHDIVHRNGQDKDGNTVNITEQDLDKLISDVESFTENVNEGLIKFRIS